MGYPNQERPQISEDVLRKIDFKKLKRENIESEEKDVHYCKSSGNIEGHEIEINWCLGSSQEHRAKDQMGFVFLNGTVDGLQIPTEKGQEMLSKSAYEGMLNYAM